MRLQSSNLYDVTAKYPELGGLADAVAAERVILDGELVVLDDAGRPRFELIQRHERQAALFIFDVLAIERHDVISLPYEERRRLLGELVEPGENWAVPAHRIGGGDELLAATDRTGARGRDGEAPRDDLPARARGPRNGARSRTGSGPRSSSVGTRLARGTGHRASARCSSGGGWTAGWPSPAASGPVSRNAGSRRW